MGDVWGRLGGRADLPAGAILTGLEAGESPAEVAARLALGPADLIAALADAVLGGDDAGGPSPVRTDPTRPGLAGALSEAAWSGLFPDSTRPQRLALAAGLLQIHDFWEASHEAAQEAGDLGERSFSAYWHGIGHRREPDPDNADYWFRRVGRHPLFGPLAVAATPLLQAHGDAGLTARLIPGGNWDPYSFIALCTGSRPGSSAAKLARSLQRREMILLLEATASAVFPAKP